ncbi:ribosomal protein S18-alanine N-acetyltransferase [Cucumibacter marinus]|uniref:ribosomal protein S18-alanine N-acetyltransferase n=1 Tax=Cucumibacter marinus TaxID=1121252 RepID=UPI00040A67BE|nr:ribosomal protein S18-alanine N-acetyltransferase [Cucumibacter marinus]
MQYWMAPAGLHIEPARTEDSTVLAKLHAASFFRGWSVSEFERFLAERDIRTYIACDAKHRIAGFAMIRIAADEAELLTIAVDKRRRKKGLGRALMAAATADLGTTPARRLLLEVDEDNAAARRLYSRLGFAEIGSRQGYYPRPDGRPATALVLRLELG